ncbi:MAG: small ribosomal subunit Rsm22 family protein [Chloroflexota bacterium]
MTGELPRELADGVERLLAGISVRDLARASAELTERYREKRERRAPVARTQADIVAYLAARMPATYAAVSAALEAVRELRPDWSPRTLLDLGAGPGTATWSAASVWPSLTKATAVEAEGRMIETGQELARSAGWAVVREASWTRGSVTEPAPGGPYDLVVMAYVLGELDGASRDRAVERAWEATAAPDGLTLIVEPGTPEGYARVMRARELLIASGGFVTAPCPHDEPCPLGGQDWCHMAVRLARTATHRAAKGGALGHEDEKFSYVAISRGVTARAGSRVLRHPQVRPRLIHLELCMPDGVRSVAVTKSDAAAFRQARKVRWGESFDYTAS